MLRAFLPFKLKRWIFLGANCLDSENLWCAQKKPMTPKKTSCIHHWPKKNLNQGVKYKIIDEDYSTLEYFMYVHNIYLEPKWPTCFDWNFGLVFFRGWGWPSKIEAIYVLGIQTFRCWFLPEAPHLADVGVRLAPGPSKTSQAECKWQVWTNISWECWEVWFL